MPYNGGMITVHHLNNSRSQRVLWLLEELGVPYEVKRYERDAKTMLAPPALLAVHPLGKSPVIVDGAATVAESGAIVEYLIDRYGACRLECRPASFNRFPRAYPRARRLSARLGTRRSLFPISRCWRIES
jgi:glutathione S-transferase